MYLPTQLSATSDPHEWVVCTTVVETKTAAAIGKSVASLPNLARKPTAYLKPLSTWMDSNYLDPVDRGVAALALRRVQGMCYTLSWEKIPLNILDFPRI